MNRNPFLTYGPLNPRIHAHLLARLGLGRQLADQILGGAYCLLLGPRFSGRTSMLKLIEQNLQSEADTVSILVDPSVIDLRNEDAFFDSLARLVLRRVQSAEHLQGRPLLRNADRLAVDQSLSSDSFNSWLELLLSSTELRIVLFFDEIERIPPHVLIRLARRAHAIFSQRIEKEKSFLRRISFNFAGAISLRLLTFEEDPRLSPFNICKDQVIPDLSRDEAIYYLTSVNESEKLLLRHDGIHAIVDYAGGDLNMIQRLASLAVDAAGTTEVDRGCVARVVEALLDLNGKTKEESLRFTAMLVEQDLDTLKLVLKLLADGSPEYQQSETYNALFTEFQITYPQLCGALILEEVDGLPSKWRFRNLITREFLRRHFTPRLLVRIFSSAGELDAALEQCEPVLAQIREEFERDIFSFDDAPLKDVIIAMTNRIYAEGSHEFAYKFFAILLTEAFGCNRATYYDYVPNEHKLVAVKFLAGLFDNDGTAYDVRELTNSEVLEVGVLRSRRFAVQAVGDENARIAIPLENLNGEVTGVITLVARMSMEKWTHVNLRVQVIQRTLRAINIALSKVELDNKKRIILAASLSQPMEQEGGTRRTPVFVAHQFDRELLENLRDTLGSASTAFEFEFVDDQVSVGYQLSAIRRRMEESKLCLYELSHANNNVFLELGMGLGLNLPGLMFLRQMKQAETRLPPILRGIETFVYPDYQSVIGGLSKRLENVLFHSLGKGGPDKGYLSFVAERVAPWRKRAKFALIFDHNHFGDQADFRATVKRSLEGGEMTAVFGLDQHVNYATLFDEPQTSRFRLVNIYSLVRHADVVLSRVERVDEDPIAAQVFIGLGIALGLEQGPSLLLARLLSSPDNSPLGIPSNLEADDRIEYRNWAELRDGLAARRKSDGVALG